MSTGSGDFSIGSAVWPGTSKLLEEMGELQQVIGKLMGSHGDPKHWSGDLRAKLVEELADVMAAIEFFNMKNMTGEERAAIQERRSAKVNTFWKWHEQAETIRTGLGFPHDEHTCGVVQDSPIVTVGEKK